MTPVIFFQMVQLKRYCVNYREKANKYGKTVDSKFSCNFSVGLKFFSKLSKKKKNLPVQGTVGDTNMDRMMDPAFED